jgi:hypothetical protein
MADLKGYTTVLDSLLTDLDHVSNEDYRKNKQYYKNTLQKLVNKLFDVGDEEDKQDGDEANPN